MIQFRCWYCNRRYSTAESRVGERLTCSCKNLLRIPKRNGGNCRVKTVVDWFVEIILCGGGGALLGCGLAVLILSQLPRGFLRPNIFPLDIGLVLVAGLSLVGFLAGIFGGERGVIWIGQLIRDRENR